MQKWLKELITNNQPLKRVGGLTFKLGGEMDLTQTINFLKTSKDRKATLDMLKTHTKNDLLHLAEIVKITCLKSSPKDDIIDNIYTSTVGLRLTNDVFKSKSEQ